MDDNNQRVIVLMMVFVGGFIILFTGVVFVLFYRFLERERAAGKRFSEAYRERAKTNRSVGNETGPDE